MALTVPTKDGESYLAMLHGDSNGAGKFDATVDLPSKNAAGQPIMVSFTDTENLPEKKG